MIFFLFGEDSYRLKLKLEEIEKHYRQLHKKKLTLMQFEAPKIEFQEFFNKLHQSSIFGEKKLFLVNNLFSASNFKEKFTKYLDKIKSAKDIVIVVQRGKILKNGHCFLTLKKESKSQEFKPLKGKKLIEWVEKQFARENLQISSMLSAKLINLYGNDLWRLANEIKKVAAYKGNSSQRKVEPEEIILPKTYQFKAEVFKTINALSQKNKKVVLTMLEKHFLQGESPFYLLVMINYHFKNLLAAKDMSRRGKSFRDFLVLGKMNPYIAQRYWNGARLFGLEELKRACRKIFEADLSIKTGKLNPKDGLRMLVAEI